ncbi:hypothetical protein CSV72_04495 [Sporosarcina sp. P20a]|uniref:PulJ/GspJ family protein n=1 Tax=Sporosarcina sp. P20a TaxID=2048256 RepID=UPI000C1721F7|nr:prepilin-type N-terminal cleavage/methylation domain-containing protein [Sporosarcina sp. P20a]PIC87239.1 hypothetical protein CSV72_04495 [Sporosarcina sp. P20a]
MKRKNERGFTLVEILASLTILGIVFISFMTIFPQMVNVNERTETKLQTMNIARKELVDLKRNSTVLNASTKTKDSLGPDDYEIYSIERSDYVLEVECHNVGNQTCSGVGKKEPERVRELYRINIKILKEEKVISETFGYIELD